MKILKYIIAIIIIFTTNWCVYCVLSKRYFVDIVIAYEVIYFEKVGISREVLMNLT